MEDQKPRTPALPPGAFVALTSALVVGTLAGMGLWWQALAAAAGYTVVAMSTPRRPPRWVVLITAGALLTACAAAAQAHARIDWALGYMLAAGVTAWSGAVVKAMPDAPAGGDSAETPAAAADDS